MRRRNFVGNLLAAGAARVLAPGGAPAFQGSGPLPQDTDVKRVLVMFKCHLDVGFIDTQANVVRKYFDHYFPHGHPNRGRHAAARETDRYVWTTGSWLLYEYLEKAAAPQRQADGAGHSRPGTLPGTRFRSPGRPN